MLMFLLVVLCTHSALGEPQYASQTVNAKLSNAEQSSTYGSRYASKALDMDWESSSTTDLSDGSHWWEASMAAMAVEQVVVKALAYRGEEVRVNLYKGDSYVANCRIFNAKHPYDDNSAQAFHCKGAVADKVKLTFREGRVKSRLTVWEVIVQGVPQKTNVGDEIIARLGSPRQSSTNDWKDGNSYVRGDAAKATDGDWETYSQTAHGYGNDWWRVPMSPLTVHQIVLKATDYNEREITVSLYRGSSKVGQCENHPGDKSTQTLSCDRVKADLVKISRDNKVASKLSVNGIIVLGAPLGCNKPTVAHGTVTPDQASIKSGSSYSVLCAVGFTLDVDADPLITCTNGELSVTPTCGPLKECAWDSDSGIPCDHTSGCSYGCTKKTCWSQCDGACPGFGSHCHGCHEWCYLSNSDGGGYIPCDEHSQCKPYRNSSCKSACTL